MLKPVYHVEYKKSDNWFFEDYTLNRYGIFITS